MEGSEPSGCRGCYKPAWLEQGSRKTTRARPSWLSWTIIEVGAFCSARLITNYAIWLSSTQANLAWLKPTSKRTILITKERSTLFPF